jgi:hypothetical protein
MMRTSDKRGLDAGPGRAGGAEDGGNGRLSARALAYPSMHLPDKSTRAAGFTIDAIS